MPNVLYNYSTKTPKKRKVWGIASDKFNDLYRRLNLKPNVAFSSGARTLAIISRKKMEAMINSVKSHF
jgi:hypothetical protein